MSAFVMNIPNLLTILRLILIPVACIPLLSIFGELTEFKITIALVAFLVASISDWLDGYLARLLNQTSNWGAFADSLADKLLIWGVWFSLYTISFLNIPLWTILVVIIRDLFITYLRSYFLKYNLYFKTSVWGKIKTFLQMFSISVILIQLVYIAGKSLSLKKEWLIQSEVLINLPRNLLIFTALFAVLSGIDYMFSIYKQKKN
ncbi:MAG: CDP-diacylglycerol--glycerol-3-phosphate 3-phosphatidyltransferase [Brevinemataceae bacterium]